MSGYVQGALFEADRTDRVVSMEELKVLWAELAARKELWNGMTEHYLHERYGDRLYHAWGGGWCVRPEKIKGCGAVLVGPYSEDHKSNAPCFRCGGHSSAYFRAFGTPEERSKPVERSQAHISGIDY